MNLKTILNKIQKERKLTSLYTGNDMDKSIVGFIVYMDRENIIIKMVEDDGTWDGYYIRKINYISGCAVDNSYLRKINRMIIEKNMYLEDLSLKEQDLSTEFLEHVWKTDGYLEFFCHEYRFCGKLIQYSGEIIRLATTGPLGDFDGEASIKREKIIGMKIYSKNLSEIALLDKKSHQLVRCNDQSIVFSDIIKESITQQDLMEIYYEEDQDSCFIGTPMRCFGNQILLKFTDSEGRFDGFRILDMEDIAYIMTNTHYLKKFKKYHDFKLRNDLEYRSEKDDMLEEMIEQAQLNNKYLQISTAENDFIGKIIAYNKKSITALVLDEYDEEDGIRYFDRDYIMQLGIDTLITKRVEKIVK